MRAALLLLLTLPAAAQFQILPSPTTADLRGIHAVTPEIAWASGTNGTVLRTIDAGAHWTLCPTPPNAEHLDFRGIQAFDAQTAILMSSGKGPLSRLYKTTDACATWTLLFTNPDPEAWDNIALAPPRLKRKGPVGESRGPLYILGDPVNKHFMVWVMKKPLKQGQRPSRLRQLPPAKAGESAFAASNSILYPVRYPPLMWFPDGLGIAINGPEGARWLQLGPNDPQPAWYLNFLPIGEGDKSIVSSIGFRGRQGVAVGGDPAKPDDASDNAAYSPNGNWYLPYSVPHGYRSAVAYSPATRTWITVGPNGTDISTDDGHNWHPLRPNQQAGDPPDADKNWNALSLPYVVGPQGRIGKLRPDALPHP